MLESSALPVQRRCRHIFSLQSVNLLARKLVQKSIIGQCMVSAKRRYMNAVMTQRDSIDMEDVFSGDFRGDSRGTALWWFYFRPWHFTQNRTSVNPFMESIWIFLCRLHHYGDELGRLHKRFDLRSSEFQAKSCVVQHIIHLLRLKNTMTIYSNVIMESFDVPSY